MPYSWWNGFQFKSTDTIWISGSLCALQRGACSTRDKLTAWLTVTTVDGVSWVAVCILTGCVDVDVGFASTVFTGPLTVTDVALQHTCTSHTTFCQCTQHCSLLWGSVMCISVTFSLRMSSASAAASPCFYHSLMVETLHVSKQKEMSCSSD